MHWAFYHVLFPVLKHLWFLHSTFEICLCEIGMEEDGKEHPLEGSLAQFKACFASWNCQVGLSRCCHAGIQQSELTGMDTKRAQHMPENSLLMQMSCQSTHWAVETCLSGFPVLMSRLSVVFPCHPGWRKAHTRLPCPAQAVSRGSALVTTSSCLSVDFAHSPSWCSPGDRQCVGRAGLPALTW